MPDKVAFVSACLFDYRRYQGNRYLPLQQHLLLAENEFAFASLWETLVSVSKHKQKHASELFWEGV